MKYADYRNVVTAMISPIKFIYFITFLFILYSLLLLLQFTHICQSVHNHIYYDVGERAGVKLVHYVLAV